MLRNITKNFKNGCLKIQQRLVNDVDRSERQLKRISKITNHLWKVMKVSACNQNIEFFAKKVVENFNFIFISFSFDSQFWANLIRRHRHPLRSQHPKKSFISGVQKSYLCSIIITWRTLIFPNPPMSGTAQAQILVRRSLIWTIIFDRIPVQLHFHLK